MSRRRVTSKKSLRLRRVNKKSKSNSTNRRRVKRIGSGTKRRVKRSRTKTKTKSNSKISYKSNVKSNILFPILPKDDNVYVNVGYNNEFVNANSQLFNYYFNKECFDTNFDFFDINPEDSVIYVSGKLSKKSSKTFKLNNKHYMVTCLLTIIRNKNLNELWNVCTPIQERKQGYLRKLFNYYLTTVGSNKDTRLYVSLNQPENIGIYEKLGFINKGIEDDSYVMDYNQ